MAWSSYENITDLLSFDNNENQSIVSRVSLLAIDLISQIKTAK